MTLFTTKSKYFKVNYGMLPFDHITQNPWYFFADLLHSYHQVWRGESRKKKRGGATVLGNDVSARLPGTVVNLIVLERIRFDLLV